MEPYKEIRIGVLGSVDAGKSTLTGVLSTGNLDDGRGLMRANILKHPHEKESGRTSDVSQKHIMVKDVYGENRVIGLIDLAGHEKYLRTTISGINRCSVDYAMIIVGANMGVLRMTLEHLTLCLSMNIPTMIVITKVDIAPKNIYENTKRELIAVIKKKTRSLRIPVIINDIEEFNNSVIEKYYKLGEYNKPVPIMSVSNVSGKGIDLLQNIIKTLPIYNNYEFLKNNPSDFIIENTYMVKGIGLVLSGVVCAGKISKGDVLHIGPFDTHFYNVHIKNIHNNFKENVEYLEAGQGGCFNVKINSKIQIKRSRIRKGIRIMKLPNLYTKFKAEVKIMHHPTTIKIGYEPTIHSGSVCQTAKIKLIEGSDTLRLGQKAIVHFEFSHRPEYIQQNAMLVFREGRTKGIGRITEVM